jgi:hypothetical protein
MVTLNLRARSSNPLSSPAENLVIIGCHGSPHLWWGTGTGG